MKNPGCTKKIANISEIVKNTYKKKAMKVFEKHDVCRIVVAYARYSCSRV